MAPHQRVIQAHAGASSGFQVGISAAPSSCRGGADGHHAWHRAPWAPRVPRAGQAGQAAWALGKRNWSGLAKEQGRDAKKNKIKIKEEDLHLLFL